MTEGEAHAPAGRVAGVFRKPERHARSVRADALELRTREGVAGDTHAKAQSWRQVLLVSLEALTALGAAPGDLQENLTVAGLDVDALASGTLLRCGQAQLRLTYPCDPCATLQRNTGITPPQAKDRRGMLAVVITGGTVAPGDPVEVLGVPYPALPRSVSARLRWLTARIPPGRVVAYADAVSAAGAPKQAVRTMPSVAAGMSESEGLPGHRLVPAGELPDEQQRLLAAEGVEATTGRDALRDHAWPWWEAAYDVV